jgi:CheY-like chemotaxis protein
VELKEGALARTILIADDNPSIRKFLCRLFEEEKDYNICAEAENGQKAIELALQCKPDLIILDLSMPVMNGLDAARKLKEIMPDVPIILFTQHAELTAKLGNVTADADRVVSKTNVMSLMDHVRELAPA